MAADPVPGAPTELPAALVGGEFRGLKVESVLAEGGMGLTLLASHPILKIPFVVKLVKHSPGRDVFREPHLAARVVSRYVVPIVDAGLEGSVPFLIHPFIYDWLSTFCRQYD